MNWTKIKNILIIIFLILNGILGYMNYQKKVEVFTLDSQQESNIKKLLYDNNIMVYTLLPPNYPPMKKLLVAPEEMDEEEQEKILKAIFGDNKNLNVSTETNKLNQNRIIYSKEDEKVGFSTGHISYQVDVKFHEKVISTKEEAKSAANEFLDRLGYDLSKLKLTFKDQGNGKYKYLYYEIYKNNFIYNSYIEFSITPWGIDRVDIYSVKPIKYTGLARSIYAPDEMLFGFMNQIKKVQELQDILVIQKIDLGYRVEVEQELMKEEEALPYYRITLADGKYFYMNAYTNEIVEE